MSDLKSFFTAEDSNMIVKAIQKAEMATSGEIRVHVAKRAGKNPLVSAKKVFDKLGMDRTELKNGVLFVLAVEERVFTIIGDSGINKNVPDGFWNKVRDVVIDNFKKNMFAKGLAEGIELAGEQLATYFPRSADDVNELSDAISYEGE